MGNNIDIHNQEGFPPLANAEIVFIGSSLTENALPSPEPESGVLEDGRSCAVLHVPGISEKISIRLLAYAIDSGVESIFLEITTYAQRYASINQPLFLSSMTFRLRQTGKRLFINTRSLLNLAPKRKLIRKLNQDVDCGVPKGKNTFDPKQIPSKKYYHFVKTEPSFGEQFRAQLARASKAGVEVIFFSPPRPQSAIDRMGADEFADLNAHLDHMSASYGVPLWYSSKPWPDDHFMDIQAHTNERGRIRFQKELADWYRARQ